MGQRMGIPNGIQKSLTKCFLKELGFKRGSKMNAHEWLGMVQPV